MRTVSFAPISAAPLLWEAEGGFSLTVVAKATLWLVHGGEATVADEQDPLGGDRYFGDDTRASLYVPSDWAPLKSRADILLVGHAYAPEGSVVPSVTARVEVGSFSKAITVVGDRVWTKGSAGLEPSDPTPFSSMPIAYELAARGPDNPVGIHSSGQIVVGALALPNLEAPVQHGVPGFGPIAPTWRARQALLNTAGRRWSDRLAGPAPRAFDYAFFNAAPADQQVDLLRMGSPIRLEHLHPDLAVFETKLPSMRPRAYVVTPGAGSREVVLRCDTLWIDADHEGATVTWRGVVAVDMRDIETGLVAVVLESKLDPHPFRHVEPLVTLGASDLANLPGTSEVFTPDEHSSIIWEPETTTGIRELAPASIPGSIEGERLTQRLTVDALMARMRAAQHPAANQRIGGTNRTLDGPSDAPLGPVLPFRLATARTEAAPPDGKARVDEERRARALEPDVHDTPDLSDDETRTQKDIEPQELDTAEEPSRSRLGGPLRLGASPLGSAELGGGEDRAETVALAAIRDETTSNERRAIDEHTEDDPTHARSANLIDPLSEDESTDGGAAFEEPLGLGVYAAISAEVAVRKRPLGEVIATRGVSRARWRISDAHYRSLFSKGAEVGAFDRAYVSALDGVRRQGPITVVDYARIAVAVERGEVKIIAAAFALSVADLMRVHRVWSRLVTEDPALAAAVAEAIRAVKGA